MVTEARRKVFCFASSRIISNFGEKPVRGGSPASESKISIIVVTKMGDLGHEEETCEIFVDEIDMSERNIAAVIII